MFKYTIALIFSVGILQAQAGTDTINSNVEVGDVFEIGKPETATYRYINFPRPNFIIKRGGIANYKGAEGKKVVITSVKEKKDGTTQVKIKRVDGSRFFGSHSVVSVDFEGATTSGELKAE